jgi:DNA-binding GntR family transcriptional regulator
MENHRYRGGSIDTAMELLELIMSEVYRLDMVVGQTEVASRLRVPRPTAIGAIAILSWLGVLSQQPFEASRVAPIAPDHLQVLARDVHVVIREAATRLVARQVGATVGIDSSNLPSTAPECLEAEFAFLGQIVADTGDPWLANMYQAAAVPLHRLLLQLRLSLSGGKLLRDQQSIVGAINRGAWQPTESAVGDHFLGVAALDNPGVNLRQADYVEGPFQWPERLRLTWLGASTSR